MRRFVPTVSADDALETGLVFSSPEVPGGFEREVVLAFDDDGRPGSAAVWFSGRNFRCGHGDDTLKPLERDGVDVAPRELWVAIALTLFGTDLDDYSRCDVAERRAGRVVHEAAEPPRDGDDWIAQQLATSPLLRYRRLEALRDARLDMALRRMLEGDDAETIAAARSLQAPLATQTAATAIADLCLGTLTAPNLGEPPHEERGIEPDTARELRMIADSMLDGPLYVPGLWPTSIDRIMVALDRRS